MDRNREGRRSTMAANGLARRRHRTNNNNNSHSHSHSHRDSPEEDGAVELHETARLRDRGGNGKKDRDRLGRSKRRRGGDRVMHSREEGGEDTSEDSINDEPEDDDDDDRGAASVRMLSLGPNPSLHRKSFPPPAKVFRPAPPTWKTADEMIGVSVPRKARSASTKRSHEFWTSPPAIAADQIRRQPSTSPVRTTMPSVALSPASPSSSNASVRKKITNGPKFRPPKSSSKSSSAAQDEIEIEIAEVLYGMMRQPQGPSKQEIMANSDSREGHKSSNDAKSRISSPISNSQSAQPLSSSLPPQNSSSSVISLSVVAPKRKKPRPVKCDDENPTIFSVRSSSIPSTAKAESDQPSKVETCSQNFHKISESGPENGGVSYDLVNSQGALASSEPQPESIKLESNVSSDSKPLTEESEKQDVGLSKEVPQSPKKESPVVKLDHDREDVKSTKANTTLSESENQREEKFQIDLMALPPPPLRSSPERNVEITFVAGDPKPLVIDPEMEVKPVTKEDDKSLRMSKEEVAAVEMDKAESHKPDIMRKERGTVLQLDVEKANRVDTSGNGSLVNKRQHQNNIQRQQQQPNPEKNVLSNSVPLPLSVPSWPGGLPPMGYMTSLQGVVSMDGTTVTSAAIPPPHLLSNQPRPKKCATHYYIARNILYHQQIARMNPFWPAAAGSAALYGAKPCNLNVVPSTELHANVPSRAPNPTLDKDHGLGMFPGHVGKDKGSQPTNLDSSQRKQILLQQALPSGAPNNILHGPAFIFPLNQQQAAAASVRPGSAKCLPGTNSGGSASASNSAPLNASGTGVAAAPPMSFSYPNMPGNETQYLAILPNNAYPFPIPAHVGGPPAYRGAHAQALPFFNGSFYSSQMLHPSQIPQQQLPPQSQQSHQNTSISTGSSSSQKHAQNQQKPNGSGSNGGGSGVVGGMQGFHVNKSQPSQLLQLQQQQQRQQLQNHNASHPARQIESEMGGEGSPSTADSRLTRTTMSIYGQNFAMPVQTPNFALMTPASINGTGSNGSHSEKTQAQQHPGPKATAEMSQAFAMSFASVNGATAAPGLDLSSIAQSHHNYQIMAGAQAANSQQKKNYCVPEEGKAVSDSSNPEEDRKSTGGKIPATVGQSIAFSRPDVSDPPVTALTGNNVIDSSARTLGLGSASSRTAAPVMPAGINTSSASSQQHLQRNQQQYIQLQKQHQFAVAAARSKTPSTSNGSVYSDHLPSTSSMPPKFSNAVSVFPQNLVQSSTTVAQSPQWKNTVRATTSQSSPSMTSPPPPSVKSLPQQQARTQQAHTQISFAANPKSSTVQVQPSSSPSPPVMAGSPTTSSMSKNAGSPRTTSTSTNIKTSQTSLASQQAKNSQAVPSRKSSPVGGRNVPSILSGPQLTPSSSTGAKPQMQQQQQQQQISKQTLQQAQLVFSNPYIHPQISQSNCSPSSTSAASGYYVQRRGPEQMQRQSSSSTSPSNGATANNTKSGGLPMPGLLHPAQFATMPPSGNHHQFVPAGFTYVHTVPSAVQVKPAEQKQPAGE
ncbi:protein TIME FOR COFFEE isoform X2 [Gastrolobium bilobum]|uniref:protein TIME FOR COFFEE isoform X2 n=1 Tax=Gastrolobium bilobum TaxID=150636 RepID=UPI002AB1175B|nr:protein TIME FOR COFFEE isoform X2 [Gastrolobium bilobum]